MLHPRAVSTAEDIKRFCALPGLTPLTPEVFQRQQPEESWLLTNDAGKDVARWSLWWVHSPPHEQHHLGLIGHLAMRDPSSAAVLLPMACKQLVRQKCTLAVG